jgi:hypothetical protein
MMADEPDRVHAKATALGLDVGDPNVLGHVAKGLQCAENASKRWTNNFDDRLIAYFKYREDRGHFPTARGDNPQLGKWAGKQRGFKRKLDKGEHAKGITSERASKLTALGFVWNP